MAMHEKCDKTYEDVSMAQPNSGSGKRNLSTAMKPEETPPTDQSSIVYQ
jgi:hypothetical protein